MSATCMYTYRSHKRPYNTHCPESIYVHIPIDVSKHANRQFTAREKSLFIARSSSFIFKVWLIHDM